MASEKRAEMQELIRAILQEQTSRPSFLRDLQSEGAEAPPGLMALDEVMVRPQPYDGVHRTT